MDSRDIKEVPPTVEDGKYLEKIYELQKELLEGYIKIEGLPPYPININAKSSQTLIKDFIGRVIEELAEAYESILEVGKITKENRYFIEPNKTELNKALNHLQNISEELADAMHFMVELLIYSNIQPEDIQNYLNKLNQEYSLTFKDDILYNAMISGFVMLDDIENNSINSISLIDIAKKEFSDDKSIVDRDWELYQACSFVNLETFNKLKMGLWEVTYHLNIARNFLKNKPWKQSQMMSDEIRFQEQVVLGFIKMMGLYLVMGVLSPNLYYIYFKKNRINLFRQRSKY